MPKLLILLIGASVFAVSFPSVFDEYRRHLAAENGAEALEAASPLVEASLPPQTGKASLAAGPDGHFRAEARLNGRPVDVLVDTGATYVAMNEETARRLGVRVSAGDFRYRTQTANGEAAFAFSSLDRVRIGNVEVRDVEVAVTKGDGLNTVLLGMSFLARLSRYAVANGRLNLTR